MASVVPSSVGYVRLGGGARVAVQQRHKQTINQRFVKSVSPTRYTSLTPNHHKFTKSPSCHDYHDDERQNGLPECTYNGSHSIRWEYGTERVATCNFQNGGGHMINDVI